MNNPIFIFSLRKIINIICQKTAKGMKPRNKMVEMEMQGTRSLPSVSFIKQALPVCYWIDLFDNKNCISLSCFNQFFSRMEVRKKII